MIELLLSLLSPLLPYIGIVAGLLAAYFYVRHQGVKAERDRWEFEQARRYRAINEALGKARQKDEEINKQTEERIHVIEEKAKDNKPSSPDKFRF